MPGMSDDYRLTIEFPEEKHSLGLGRLLRKRNVEAEIQLQLGHKVVVTHDGPHVFLYTATHKQAEAAKEVVRKVLEEHEAEATVSSVERWHPVEHSWEDATKNLPLNEQELEAEHERWENEQAKSAQELGYADWEVRIDLPTHDDAVELAERLEAEGITPIVRRWKYLLIGTATEDDARRLAERMRTEAPEATGVKAEPSYTVVWELTANNPFSMFGGLGPGPG
jgi:hypothetical protein